MTFPRFFKNDPVGSHASFTARFKGQVYASEMWYKNQNFPSEEITSGNTVVDPELYNALLTLLSKLIQIDLFERAAGWPQMWLQRIMTNMY